jgi:hypothetical protein
MPRSSPKLEELSFQISRSEKLLQKIENITKEMKAELERLAG